MESAAQWFARHTLELPLLTHNGGPVYNIGEGRSILRSDDVRGASFTGSNQNRVCAGEVCVGDSAVPLRMR